MTLHSLKYEKAGEQGAREQGEKSLHLRVRFQPLVPPAPRLLSTSRLTFLVFIFDFC